MNCLPVTAVGHDTRYPGQCKISDIAFYSYQVKVLCVRLKESDSRDIDARHEVSVEVRTFTR